MPKVSVIIPVYGVEKYIERCARSLFEQTLDDIEYLFIDDCTPDKSIEVLKKVLEEYPNRKKQVIIHRMERNSGQAAVRKWGMQNAKGDYVIHCDTDDWLVLSAYKTMYDIAISRNSDVVVCGYIVTNGRETNLVNYCSFENKDQYIRGILTCKYSGALWNKLVKRDLYIDSIKYPVGNMGEDMTICLQFILNSTSICSIDKPLYYYFVNEKSITKQMTTEGIENRFYESKKNADLLIEIFKNRGLYFTYKSEIDILLFLKKNIIKPLLRDRFYYQLWRDSFADINFRVLFNSLIPIKQRIGYILNYLRLI